MSMSHISRVTLLIVVACTLQAATVGLENLQIKDDYNDITLTTTGLGFNLVDFYTSPGPLYLNESPFPDGFLFDYAEVESDTVITFLLHQSAYNDVAMVKVGTGSWVDIPTTGTLTIAAELGSRVIFGIRSEGHETFYSDPALNRDGGYYAAVTFSDSDGPQRTPEGDVPEPDSGQFMLCGGLMLIFVALLMRKRRV